MGDAPTIAQVIANVIPVVIGGLLAVGGGAGAQWLMQERKAAQERRERLADKFEAFVSAIYEHEHWLDELKNERAFGEGEKPGISPFSKVQAISLIYFPEFENIVANLQLVSLEYEKWITGAHGRRLRGEADLGLGFGQAYMPYMTAKNKVVDELKALAKREFQKPQPFTS